ncbi:MAG: response regulator [Gemmatales bacterium]
MTATDTLTVVIADDNIDHAQSLSSLINLWGYEAHTFLDVDSAIEFCAWHPPDVLMLDIGIPLRIDGITAARNAHRRLGALGMKIVAVTGFDDPDTRRLAEQAGCEEYFTKPVDLAKLEAYLDSVSDSRVEADWAH